MTFEAAELSHQDGSPVELYTFSRNGVAFAWYTSVETNKTIGADTYLAWPGGMKRGKIATTSDEGRNALEVKVARDHPIAYLIHHRPRTGVIGMTVTQYHRSDASDLVVIWVGRAMSAKRDKKSGDRILQGMSRSITQNRTGLRRLCSANCMHELFGPFCRLDPDDWKHETTIASISGNLITLVDVDGALDYNGGTIERVDSDGVTDTSAIEEATGAALLLDIAIWDAEVGDPVTILPGCDWTMAACDAFGNSENFGGRMHVPDKNPGTDSVFS